MDSNQIAQVLHNFLARSPRTAVDVQVLINGEHRSWRYGYAENVESPVFEIGSVGKTFTTTLLALLVARQQIRLTDTVAHFYPDLRWGKDVTLQQLASHTSGLPANPFTAWQIFRRGRQLAEAFQEDDLMRFLQSISLMRKTSEKAQYSNVGMALLGRILGDVCGESYGDAVVTQILQPLGMHDTHLAPERYEPSRLMTGHDAHGRAVPPFVWRGMEAAGVWRSTGDDMMTFMKAQLGMVGSPWDTLAHLTTQPCANMGRDIQVGLGWMLSEVSPYGRSAWHTGGTWGQHSMAAWMPEQAAAVVILTDRIPPWWHHLMASRQIEVLPERLLLALSVEPQPKVE